MIQFPPGAALRIGKGSALYKIDGGIYGLTGLTLYSIPGGHVRGWVKPEQLTMVGTWKFAGIARSPQFIPCEPMTWAELQASHSGTVADEPRDGKPTGLIAPESRDQT